MISIKKRKKVSVQRFRDDPVVKIQNFISQGLETLIIRKTKQAIIYSAFFVISIIFFCQPNLSESVFYYKHPHAMASVIPFIISIFMAAIAVIFARSTFDFCFSFTFIYALIFLRIHIVGFFSIEAWLFIALSGVIFYLLVWAVDVDYYELILANKKGNLKGIKNQDTSTYKSYEKLHSDLDHASNILPIIVTTSIVLIKVGIIKDFLVVDSIVLATAYIAIIKFCISTMKRNLTKLKN